MTKAPISSIGQGVRTSGRKGITHVFVLGKVRWLAVLLVAIWVIQALNIVTGYALKAWFGLIPRRLGGLDGTVFKTVLHGSVAHAASNVTPLAAIGALVISSARSVALPATLGIVGSAGRPTGSSVAAALTSAHPARSSDALGSSPPAAPSSAPPCLSSLPASCS